MQDQGQAGLGSLGSKSWGSEGSWETCPGDASGGLQGDRGPHLGILEAPLSFLTPTMRILGEAAGRPSQGTEGLLLSSQPWPQEAMNNFYFCPVSSYFYFSTHSHLPHGWVKATVFLFTMCHPEGGSDPRAFDCGLPRAFKKLNALLTFKYPGISLKNSDSQLPLKIRKGSLCVSWHLTRAAGPCPLGKVGVSQRLRSPHPTLLTPAHLVNSIYGLAAPCPQCPTACHPCIGGAVGQAVHSHTLSLKSDLGFRLCSTETRIWKLYFQIRAQRPG